jgi:hypothetical protein
VAEDGTATTSEKTRGLADERRLSGVPDGIDAAMDAMQQSRLRTPLNRSTGETDSQELLMRHHTALPTRELRHRAIAG